MQKNVHLHGFTAPFNPLQVISWVIFAYDLLTFFSVDMVSLAYNPALAGTLSVLYLALSASTVYYCVKATRCDPSDPTIKL